MRKSLDGRKKKIKEITNREGKLQRKRHNNDKYQVIRETKR